MSKKSEPQMRNFAPRFPRFVNAQTPEKPDGKTQGFYRDECNINNIVATYRRSEDPALLNPRQAQPVYADLPDETDLHSSLNKVQAATSAFNALPAAIRERYGNNAVNFVAALGNPSETAFLIEQGVLDAPVRPSAAPSAENKNEGPTAPLNPPAG